MLSPSEHKEKSLETLDLALGVFQKLQIPIFLFLGTALGFYRDHDFCPGDVDDIDLALDKKYFDRKDEITSELFKAGLSTGYQYIHKDEFAPELCYQRSYGDTKDEQYTKVDLFFIQDNCWRFYFDHDTFENQTRQLSKNYFTESYLIQIGKRLVPVPSPIEQYLAENYGDWKTPVSRENFTWHKDNKTLLVYASPVGENTPSI